MDNQSTINRANIADFGSRFVALLIDGFILVAANFILAFILLGVMGGTFPVYIYFITSLVSTLYKPVMEANYSATLGKMVMNIKVVDQSGNPIETSQAFIRSFIGILSFLFSVPTAIDEENSGTIESPMDLFNREPNMMGSVIAMLAIADIIVYFVNASKNGQSLHDIVAKTVVVRNQ